MAQLRFQLTDGRPKVAGCFGNREDLWTATPAEVLNCCDIAEIRLDLVMTGTTSEEASPWQHLQDVPLLFTARRQDEGGARQLTAAERMALLEPTLATAAWIDIEVASIHEMKPLLQELEICRIPWLASFHDFKHLPDLAVLTEAARRALDAGASLFKAAVVLQQPSDLARLAEFQLADHALPVATMGMGPLATVSRLLCAQCGSVLNYGYLGQTATAPGQWEAALLQQTIARLVPWRPWRP